jgi:predicted alpha-1,6-mannanase (GH76 family)
MVNRNRTVGRKRAITFLENIRIFSTQVLLLIALSILSGCATRRAAPYNSRPPIAPDLNYLQQSTKAVERLQAWYSPSTGLYQSTGWWNSANVMTVLVDYSRVSKSKQYDPVFANIFDTAQKTSPGFLNNFYDDEGWWALAWIDAYDLTGNPKYLSIAQSIFSDMSGGWDETCSGGIWWSKDRKYKNAIANELFLSVAAHLAKRVAGPAQHEYLKWADKEWNWFRASGLINSKNLINDGLGDSHGQTAGAGCGNNGQTTWTYNQGVILGGLVELSTVNHDPSLIETAQKIATAATTNLVDGNGILHDTCEPDCGADGVQFKGIFVRNLVLLESAYPKPALRSFVFKNAESIWRNARGTKYELGQVWSGPFNFSNAGIQGSALDALVGAALLHDLN